jgi:hypothetical protein
LKNLVGLTGIQQAYPPPSTGLCPRELVAKGIQQLHIIYDIASVFQTDKFAGSLPAMPSRWLNKLTTLEHNTNPKHTTAQHLSSNQRIQICTIH